MSIYVVIQWSATEGAEVEVERFLGVVHDHISSEHPGILSVRMFRQFAGPRPHRAYDWWEEYESLSSLEQQNSTAECDEVWLPIREIAVRGSFRQSIWSDAGKAVWLER